MWYRQVYALSKELVSPVLIPSLNLALVTHIYLNNLLWPVGGKNGAMCMVKRLALKRAIATNTAFTSSQQDIKS
ncbi:TPA: hypothetical protein I7778_16755 [Vibrio vulnificus]|nr:hypothetical protein [Vibrio vulnificus]